MTAENNEYVRSALLLNGSAPLSEMATLLLMSYPKEVCSCTLYLENAASCSQTSSAHVVLGVYQPWCFLLAECSTMAKMLLRAAFYVADYDEPPGNIVSVIQPLPQRLQPYYFEVAVVMVLFLLAVYPTAILLQLY